MTEPAPSEAPPETLPEFSRRMADDLASLDNELAEIDLLIVQATTEAGRHEGRRVAGGEKIEAANTAAESAGTTIDPALAADLNAQLVQLTRRAALMATQVEVLEGKRRVLGRYRDSLAAYIEALAAIGDVPVSPDTLRTTGAESDGVTRSAAATAAQRAIETGIDPAVSRLLLDAQEHLRREIARAMHDGPAQSLTNIVLQAQIVDRLVADDPTRVAPEVRELIAMVQRSLEATKSFIFDVRPMVLDDLGLVPTLRRATRERAKSAGIPIEFESMGTDRRLPMDFETGLFRILDEAMVAYVAARADWISVRLDWAEQLEARVSSARETKPEEPAATPEVAPAADLPPALAAMMEDRRSDARDAVEAARRDAMITMPPSTWREIEGRATTLGLVAELLRGGAELRIVGDLAVNDGDAIAAAEAAAVEAAATDAS